MRNLQVCLCAVVVSMFVIVGCGSSTEQADPTTPDPVETTPDETPEEPATDEAASFSSLDFDGRRTVMMERVMPAMGTIFRELDSERFLSFTCATCHMESMQEVNFNMPNGLAPLNPADIPNLSSSDDERIVATAEAMFQRVTPGMIEILGEEPYNHETHEGFGCLNCHATAE